ncbi:hypothetical protein [Geminocystis sp. GBBB08]|uniref:hypothetical protein n=1 Tax=Geminocystis sp. GBBB08 TaxID=2604140 RepID=UPI0027E2546C|nr:hypothetical protein [Geminocystis sp. GBBB08]MBL1208783.1 hypothetical protein [Geminocystis sp. GBBB08]
MLFRKFTLLFSLIFLNVNITAIIAQNNRINNFNQLNHYFLKLGLNIAKNICQKYTRSDLRQQCNEIINNSSYLDFNAVFLCENIFFISTQTINCFQSISNKFYTDSELLKCGNSTNEYKIYDCLKHRGKNVNKNKLDYQYEHKIALDKAQNICNAFTNSTTKNDCNNIINNSYFLDMDAISLCQTKFSISTKILKCFATIKNKTYTFGNLSQCDQESTEAKILGCLLSKGFDLNTEI